jgi:hypothetical protein
MHARLFACAIIALPACAKAQTSPLPESVCGAPTAEAPISTLWELSSGASEVSAAQIPVADLIARLQGQYRLLIINTEGYSDKAIAIWNLQIDATSASRIALPFVGDAPGVTYLMTGTMELDSAFALPGQEPRTERISDAVQGLAFDASRGILWLRGAPFRAGADQGSFGRIYRVRADGALSGRWTWPSSSSESVPTPVGPLREQVAGYFCATRTD